MPRTLVQSLVEVIDACVEGIPYVPLDEANMQARGLGSMVAFWERMRHICPKVNIYHGPIYGKDGAQCVTSHDLDEAMLATRDFWFQTPAEYDEEWQPILDCYAEGEPWKPFCPPDDEMFLNTLLHTKDSAPGPDGLPYSAWRLLPRVTVEAMKSCFLDIINGTALPPHQVGVWIPKAKIGPEADSFRPLGMPNTLERLVDGSVAAHAMRQTAHTMHPSQAVMSCFKEPQKAVSCIQKILDGDTAAMALLADLSKAFERVNPYWILELLPYFGLTTADLNRLRQASARFILKRHWLEAEILPHVLRYFGIATLLDPAVSATIAATGLYLREGNPVEDLGYQNGREECGNARQKSVVLALMDLWSPYVGLEELVGAVAATHGPIPKKLSALKKVILNRMELEAKSRIIKKIHKEGWSGGISPEWVVLLAGAPKKLCNGTGRYTLLRWAVNQDDDVGLSMRGTRHQQKCGTCGC